MRARAAMAILVLGAAPAVADEVYLRGGGRVSGIVLEETDQSISVEIGAGLVTLSRAGVDHIVRTKSPLAIYRAKAAALADDDVNGWLSLASWAKSVELGTQAREAYQHVLDIQPANALAHRALGEVLVDDHWMSRDAAMQAQGYVYMDGEWITREQRDAILAQREDSRQERLALLKERAAADEAEARVREAQARARAAEADAQAAADAPVFAGYGYSPYVAPVVAVPVPVMQHHHRRHEGDRDRGDRDRRRDEERPREPQRPPHVEMAPAIAHISGRTITPASIALDEKLRAVADKNP